MSLKSVIAATNALANGERQVQVTIHGHRQSVTLGSGLLDDIIKSLADLPQVMIVADTTTYAVAGRACYDALAATTNVAVHVFPHDIVATMEAALSLIAAARGSQWLLAVSSGTASDLSKYAATQLRIPYSVVATAPSMNGYSSATASLRHLAGGSESYPCTPARHLWCDTEILTTASDRLLQAGIGDALCRQTCAIDALFARVMAGIEDDSEIWQFLAVLEAEMLPRLPLLLMRDPSSLRALTILLLAQGWAMQLAGSSHYASQGEHMLAHWLEHHQPETSHALFHGELVAATAQMMDDYQRQLLAMPCPSLRSTPLLAASSVDAAKSECYKKVYKMDWQGCWRQFCAAAKLEQRQESLGSIYRQFGLLPAIKTALNQEVAATRLRYTTLDLLRYFDVQMHSVE
jgi:glycerol dehydrogenase-like iron-containing ADH family enzyme